MKDITRTQIEEFLAQKGYNINRKMCSELENGIYDCWFKPGTGKIKLLKEKKQFQESILLGIFYNRVIIEEFKQFVIK
jgi:hypothetical protein